MSVTLVDPYNPNDISVNEMKDGDVGVITSWPTKCHIGCIIQRHDDSLVALGKPSTSGWPNFLYGIRPDNHSFRVRILTIGTKLKVI